MRTNSCCLFGSLMAGKILFCFSIHEEEWKRDAVFENSKLFVQRCFSLFEQLALKSGSASRIGMFVDMTWLISVRVDFLQNAGKRSGGTVSIWGARSCISKTSDSRSDDSASY